jgi:hypothetical protein
MSFITPQTGISAMGRAATFLAIVGLLVWLSGYHIVWQPTPDQLYGCTIEQQASNGDCP